MELQMEDTWADCLVDHLACYSADMMADSMVGAWDIPEVVSTVVLKVA